MRLKVLVACLAVVFQAGAADGFFDSLKRSLGPKADASSLQALAQEDVVSALKQALANGFQQAIASLGTTNGFLQDASVSIAMPASLKSTEKVLRAAGQGALVDNFVQTMNRAAERAVPQAAVVLGESIKQMSIADAKSILTSTNSAATEYFKKAAGSNLFTVFLPIVKTSTDEVGVTSAYKQITDKAGASLGKASGFLGAFGVKKEAFDVDQYVTTKALDGLYLKMAEKEKAYRENPAARNTELLQKVFGVLKR